METDEPPSQSLLPLAVLWPLLSISLDGPTVGALFLLIFLLMASALISGSEVAFFSLSSSDIKNLKQAGDPVAQHLENLKSKPRSLLASILIANNFINIAIVIVSDYIVWNAISKETFLDWGAWMNTALEWGLSPEFWGRLLNFLITVVLVTFMLVLFGEVAPKVYANVNNVKFSRFMSRPLLVLSNILGPASRSLVALSRTIERRIQGKNALKKNVNRDDIDRAIELTVRHDKHATKEIDILKSIVKFSDVSVKQIMCSRVDVVAADLSTPYHDLLELIRNSGFSRIPIFENDFDNILGILYVKDLLGNLEKDNQFEWQQLLRDEILYVPENKKINELLREFQLKRLHMAIVVDEYGGSSGLVTLEDVLEEVIGDIKDEFDQDEEVDYVQLNSREYIFEGKTMLNDVCRVLGVPTETFDDFKGDADTIAGLLLEYLGKMPMLGQEVQIAGFRLKVISVSPRRIEKIKITLRS